MKKTFFVLGLAVVGAAANAQISFVGSPIFEDFDSLIASTGTFSATPGVQSAIPGEGQWQGTKLAGTGTTATGLLIGFGGQNAGSLYGLANAGSAEHALGSLASGSNIMAFGVQITNNTGGTLAWMNISFTQENWRTSTTTQNTIAASWARSSVSAATATDFLSSASSFTGETGWNLVGPAPVTTNGAIDGNVAANQVARNATLTFATPLANGESIWVRWQDVNDAGNDATLAIDNMTISGNATPEPATMAALGLGVAALLRRRKK